MSAVVGVLAPGGAWATALNPQALVLAAADSRESGESGQQGSPGPSSDTTPASLGSEASGGAQATHWARAPIKYWGYMGLRYIENKASDTTGVTGLMEEAQINGSTYIWQPWFAVANADLGLSSSASKSYQSSSKAVSVTGDASALVFPMSRFPLQAYIDVADSRTNQELVGTSAFVSTTVGANQSYTPANSNARYNGGFTYNSMSGNEFGKDSQFSFNGSMDAAYDNHRYGVTGTDLSDRRSGDSGQSNIFNLIARDKFEPSTTLTVDTLGSVNRSAFDVSGVQTIGSFMQTSSAVNWRPAEDSPLLVSSSVHASVAQASSFTSQLSTTNRALGAGGGVGVSYQLGKNIRLNASGGVNLGETSGTHTTNENGGGGIAYQGDPIRLGNFIYLWGVSSNGAASVSKTTSTTTAAIAPLGQGVSWRLNESANHSLVRAINFGDDGSKAIPSIATFRLSESIASSQGTGIVIRSLQNVAALSWTRASDTLQVFSSVSASDAITSIGSFDMFNAQASVSGSLSRYSDLTGSVTLQASRQTQKLNLLAPIDTAGVALTSGVSPADTEKATISSRNSGVGIDLTYTNRRAFGVPRLSFSSILTADTMTTESRAYTLGAPVVPVTASWENRFNYKIGALSAELYARVIEAGGKRDAMIFFSVRRQFQGRM